MASDRHPTSLQWHLARVPESVTDPGERIRRAEQSLAAHRADLSVRGRIGVLRRWAKTTSAERRQQTEAAREGLLAKFARQADPAGRMSELDREAAARRLLAAHMAAISRSRKKTARQDDAPGR